MFNEKGSTLIEVLVSVAVVSFLTLTIYMTLTSAVSHMGESKQRVGAVSIANEKMEIIRNLDYDDVGIVDGIIDGPMLATEIVTRNGFEYEVSIDVRYVDDSLDGTGGDDLINTDYKLVQVTAEWEHLGKIDSVEFVSSFVPDGVETDMGGGTLAVNTMDSGSNIVSDVTVRIESIENSPSVDYTTTTDNFGSLLLQGVPSQTYRITLSKDGYEDVTTYPSYPESSFVPQNPDFFVDAGSLNSKNFFIDPSSDVVFKTKSIIDGADIEGVLIQLIGGKVIGSNPETFNVDETLVTNSSGEASFEDVSSGDYIIVDGENLGVGDYTVVEEVTIFNLATDENREIELFFADESIPSLHVRIIDDSSDGLIQEAAIGVVGPSDFSQSGNTNESGTLYFPREEDPVAVMENEEYTIEARKSGYEDYSGTVTLDGLKTEEIRLIPSS